MKINQYVRVAIVFGIGIAGIFLFLPRKDALGASAVVVAMLATVLVGQLPGPKALILRNPRAITVVGWTLAGLGLIVSLALGWNADQSAMIPGLMLSVVGIALVTLPRSLKAADEARAQNAEAPRSTPSAANEGLEALLLPFRNLRTSVVVLGPWLALFLAAPTAAITPGLIFGSGWIKNLTRGEAEVGLLVVVAVILIMYGALMVAAIQWSRFVAQGSPPPFGVPWRPLWSFAWRWIVFGGLSRIPDRLGPWLTTHAPSLPHWASVSLTSLAGLAFLTLISPMGLVLPAVALGKKDTSIVGTLASRRVFGRRFYLGALVVLSPFALMSWLFGLLPDGSSASMASGTFALVLLVIWVPVLFATVVGAMAYLTNVHLRAASVS
ncbi:hypothetical protein [Phenylobacterium sp.]|uniref:hypothetical protein n=1 Tax=Phenylobacterium sp. TaxID=1871053 RepID=UPI002F4220D3